MTRILMVGDSWPAGEFKINPDQTHSTMTHRGVQEYFLEDNISVINICNPGGSNLQSVKRLSDFLLTNNLDNDTVVLFWITEFFREIWVYNNAIPDLNLDNELKKNYVVLRDHWIYRPYYMLQEIAKNYNLKFYILGGCSDTIGYNDFELDFPNLQILCQSITNLIINNDPFIKNPVFCQFMNGWIDPFLTLVKQDISNVGLAALLEDIEKGQQRLDLYKTHKQWFYPDGIHPNRVAHKKIYEYICNTIGI